MDKNGNWPQSLKDDEDHYKKRSKKTNVSSIASKVNNATQAALKSVGITVNSAKGSGSRVKATDPPKICYGYGPSTPYYKDANVKIPVACPPANKKVVDILSGIGKGLQGIAESVLSGLGSLAHVYYISKTPSLSDDRQLGDSILNSISSAMKTEKFWYQIGVTLVAGVATLTVGALLLLSPIAVTGLAIAGSTGAVVSVTHSVSGQYYDYDVTYGRDLQKMLEAGGFNSVEEMFGYNAVKQVFNGVAGFATGKKISKYIGGIGVNSPGVWEKTNEAMSDASRSYQKYITGADDGLVYKVNGVKFDGFKDGILIDAKGSYGNLVDASIGDFKPFFTGKGGIISQANRQLTAAGGTPINWYFQDNTTYQAYIKLLTKENITGIQLIYQP